VITTIDGLFQRRDKTLDPGLRFPAFAHVHERVHQLHGVAVPPPDRGDEKLHPHGRGVRSDTPDLGPSPLTLTGHHTPEQGPGSRTIALVYHVHVRHGCKRRRVSPQDPAGPVIDLTPAPADVRDPNPHRDRVEDGPVARLTHGQSALRLTLLRDIEQDTPATPSGPGHGAEVLPAGDLHHPNTTVASLDLDLQEPGFPASVDYLPHMLEEKVLG
jgi:hypothetical protein